MQEHKRLRRIYTYALKTEALPAETILQQWGWSEKEERSWIREYSSISFTASSSLQMGETSETTPVPLLSLFHPIQIGTESYLERVISLRNCDWTSMKLEFNTLYDRCFGHSITVSLCRDVRVP